MCDIEFDVLKKDVLSLKKIYFTVDINNIDPRSEYVHAYSQIWIRFDFDAVYDTKNGTLISIDFNDLRNGNDDCWMCRGCDDDEDYDDTSDEQIKDIIKALDVDPNQMSLFYTPRQSKRRTITHQQQIIAESQMCGTVYRSLANMRPLSDTRWDDY